MAPSTLKPTNMNNTNRGTGLGIMVSTAIGEPLSGSETTASRLAPICLAPQASEFPLRAHGRSRMVAKRKKVSSAGSFLSVGHARENQVFGWRSHVTAILNACPSSFFLPIFS